MSSINSQKVRKFFVWEGMVAIVVKLPLFDEHFYSEQKWSSFEGSEEKVWQDILIKNSNA